MKPAAYLGFAALVMMAPGLAAAYDGEAGAEMERVPVLTHAVAAGQILNATDVTMSLVPAKTVYAGTVRSMADVEGMAVSRSLSAGKPISRIHLKDVPTVARDSMVTLVYRRPGLNLSGQARALADAKMGESVRVLNPESRTTLVATVVAPGIVEIR